MQFSTYIIVLTITGLAGAWWYSHSGSTPVVMADNASPAKPLAIPSNDIVTDTQAQPSNDLAAAVTDPAAPPQQLAPALNAAISQANNAPATNAAAVNKPEQQPSAEPQKTQVSKKPAYLRHQHDDDEDDDA